MNKDINYFYQRLEKQTEKPVITDEDIERYVNEHFQELIEILIRLIAKVVMNSIHTNE